MSFTSIYDIAVDLFSPYGARGGAAAPEVLSAARALKRAIRRHFLLQSRDGSSVTRSVL